MKNSILIASMLFAASGLSYAATNYYVWKDNPAPQTPFTNWAMAATNIQAAVDLTLAGDTVWVTNGTYDTGATAYPGDTVTNRVCVTTAITLRSVNGPAATIIKGSGAVQPYCRCVFMTNGATLIGFTITNGYSSVYGGGIEYYGGVVSNCVISGNTANNYGGGVSVRVGTLANCVISGNSVFSTWAWAGGVSTYNANVNNCVISGNSCTWVAGGIQSYMATTMRNCIVSNNYSARSTGGVRLGAWSAMYGCLV